MSASHIYVSSQANLVRTLNLEILPFWQSCIRQGTLMGRNNIRLNYAYCLPNNALGTVVISSGRIETYLKYQELIFELYQNGYAVFIIDHRGQGLSQRMTLNRQLGYVDSFNNFVTDLAAFTEQVVLPKLQGKLMLLCHSMGCAIGSLLLLSKPDWVQKAVLCAPMFGIQPTLPVWLAKALILASTTYNKCMGKNPDYFFGQTDYHADDFCDNRLTSSPERYQRFREIYSQNPQVQLGGVSPRWLHEAMNAMNTIERSAASIQTPLLVFSANNDRIIDNQRQRRVIARIKCARCIEVAGAKHEILMERDEIRTPVITEILDFFSE